MLSTSTVTWIVAGAVSAALGAWWWNRRKKRSPRGRVVRRRLTELRRELRRMVHDEAVASRLVAKERERHPGLSERALLERILRRLERDRGR